MKIIRQQFSVPFEYPVWFGRDVFGKESDVFELFLNSGRRQVKKILVFVDDGVALADPDILKKIETCFASRPNVFSLMMPPQVVAGGEVSKRGWGQIQKTMMTIGNCHLCRQSYVVAVGGGSMLDGVGFAAALVHRGIRLVRVPTSVLAQNDAGVGVKNGMDEHNMKNFVGTFAPPFAVLNDFDFLRTLPDKYWFGGIAEAVKVAVIKDKSFFDEIAAAAPKLRRRDEQAIERIVMRCAELHLEHIRSGGDPFEMGSARPLDFGHWAAHKLEIKSGYTLGHGQAVAIGIALDCRYARNKGLISSAECDAVLKTLEACGLPIASPDLDESVLAGLEEFREHLGGELCITLPKGIGGKVEVHEMDLPVLRELIRCAS